MTSHFRELQLLFTECLGQPDFDTLLSIDDARPIKQHFADKAIVAAKGGSIGFRAAHEVDALLRVCNALITWKRGGSAAEVVLSGMMGAGTNHAAGAAAEAEEAQKHAESEEAEEGEEEEEEEEATNTITASNNPSAAPTGPLHLVDELRDETEVRLAWKFLVPFTHDETALQIVDATLARAVVEYHYVTARPRQFDMFVHLSASEMFFIDGDSLLMAALSSPHVDWDCMQPLHVMHNCQAILHRLQRRGAHFQVIFFDNMAWIWERAPQKLFVRQNLCAALRAVAASNPAAGLEVYCFASYHCPAFAEHLSYYAPEFVLVSDGEQVGRPHALQELFHHPPSIEHDLDAQLELRRPYRSLVDDPVHGDAVAFYYRCFHLWLTAQRIKVVYSSRIIAKENAMVVFAVTVESNRFAVALVVNDAVTALATELEHAVPAAALPPSALRAASDKSISLREQVICGAVHAYLRRPAVAAMTAAQWQEEQELCMALVVSAYCAGLMDATLRAQRRVAAAPVAAFLHRIAPYMQAVLQHRGCLAGRGEEFDLYDGHLLCAVMAHMRETALSALLDESGVGDVAYDWQKIQDPNGRGEEEEEEEEEQEEEGKDKTKGEVEEARALQPRPIADLICDAPLQALPAVHFLENPPTLDYRHIRHDLIESLAGQFKVGCHSADVPFPPGLGNANRLSGWAVSRPFDKLNDVVDSYVEEARKTMTDRERRREAEKNVNFIQDAALQAESMGIRGFTTEQLALVRSESDSEEDENEAGGSNNNNNNNSSSSGKRGAKKKKGSAAASAQAHAGQRNRKTRSKEETIREAANMRDANRTVRNTLELIESLLRKTETGPDGASKDQRKTYMDTLQSALRDLRQTNFGKKFESHEMLRATANANANAAAGSGGGGGDASGANVSLPLAMWRLLVESSGMREAEFVFTLDERKGGNANTTANTSAGGGHGGKKHGSGLKVGTATATQQLFGFTLIERLVSANCTSTGHNAHWGAMERLRLARPGGLSMYEASAYLTWVYLTHVQLHFQLKLMCRVVKLMLDEWKLERERARVADTQPDIRVGTPLFLYCHHHVLGLIRDHGVAISADDLDLVRGALAHFDFVPTYYEKLDAMIAKWQNRPLSVLPPSMRPRQKIWNESPEMTQLMHMGHLFERPVIPERDPRVVFNPDDWQRELLDIVDKRGSAVVCAPTSAGKTFISYYCMYNALRSSNKKVVVYIAPSRALINQAVADVCARYGSKNYALPGKSVYGVHGGMDYYRYLNSCQVLITLPEIMEKILLSPLYKDWVKNLDYAILDEIHTMESSGNGEVWARVLALLPCPYVALSATLGETQELCGWLNRVQRTLQAQQPDPSRDFVVHEIPSQGGSIQRWNDIRKYIYLPPPGFNPPLKKLTARYEQRYIQDLHPLSVLTLEQLQRGFPPDITLVPSEVVQLYEKMNATFTARTWANWKALRVVQEMRLRLEALRPARYFAADCYITQRRARQYEADVKAAFVSWVVLCFSTDLAAAAAAGLDAMEEEQQAQFQAELTDVCESILHSFSLHLREEEQLLDRHATEAARRRMTQADLAFTHLAQGTAAGEEEEAEAEKKEEEEGRENNKENAKPQEKQESGSQAAATTSAEAAKEGEETPAYFPDSKQFVQANIINVLRELNTRDMGPTIVFSFETEDCADLVKTVVERLERAEAEYRQTAEFATYAAAIERKAAAVAAARRQRESTLKQKRLTTDEDGNRERNDRTVDDEADLGAEEDYVVPDVLPEFTFIDQTRTVDPKVVEKAVASCRELGDELAARAILRGVGIHHAGMKGKLRRHMEILYRKRHCGVIFATETLALGVHSPCRSVVLAGDHVLLNTTQFRQMMGRAGRRGLDFLGHLVFLSVSLKKITRLMTSSMTVIKGNIQVDPITQLRLLQLYDYAAHRDDAKAVDECQRRATALATRLFVNPLFFEGRAEVEGGNMEPMMVELGQMLLGVFQAEGLHFADRPSSLGSLLIDVMTVFSSARVGMEGFAFFSMLTRGVLRRAHFTGRYGYLNSGVYSPSPCPWPGPHKVMWRQPCNEAVAELLAYLFSKHRMCGVPLEVHRSVLSDPVVQGLWREQANRKRHRVVLAPLRLCAPIPVLNNVAFFRVVSAFYSFLAGALQEPAEDRLPYMTHRARKKRPIFGSTVPMPIFDKLRESAVPFQARHPFVALSGCGDFFVNSDDLVSTLRRGLYCDYQLLPVLDLTDGCRHDGAQVLINACVADFARCNAQFDSERANYRFSLLEELNGLTQSESYAVLNHAEHTLATLAGLTRNAKLKRLEIFEELFPETDELSAYAGVPAVLNFAHHLHALRPQIDQRSFVIANTRGKLADRLQAAAVAAGEAAGAGSPMDDDDDL